METGAKKKKIMIRVRDLRKEYRLKDDTVVALKRINLDIEQGEICCIFGTSGSGKSTLLNQLAGLEKPTYGDVYIRGVAVTRLSEKELAEFRQKHIGFVFQSYNLLPFMNAAENVAVPLMFRGVSKRERMKKSAAILKKVGLANRLNHYPKQMSGGQHCPRVYRSPRRGLCGRADGKSRLQDHYRGHGNDKKLCTAIRSDDRSGNSRPRACPICRQDSNSCGRQNRQRH